MNHLELGISLFQTLDIILPLMHPDQFFRMSCLWSEEQGCHSRVECVGGGVAVRVYPISDCKANGLGDQG